MPSRGHFDPSIGSLASAGEPTRYLCTAPRRKQATGAATNNRAPLEVPRATCFFSFQATQPGSRPGAWYRGCCSPLSAGWQVQDCRSHARNGLSAKQGRPPRCFQLSSRVRRPYCTPSQGMPPESPRCIQPSPARQTTPFWGREAAWEVSHVPSLPRLAGGRTTMSHCRAPGGGTRLNTRTRPSMPFLFPPLTPLALALTADQ